MGTALHAELPSVTGAWHRATERFRWDDHHRRLAAHPALASCTKAEVRRIAHCADEVEIPAGEHLVHRDAIGYWFFLVADGTHVGDVAILGFGPQPRSVVASETVRAFVIGRRDLLSLVYDTPGLQRGLFPDVPPEDVTAHIRGMRAEGTAAWRRLRRPVPKLDERLAMPPPPGRRVDPGGVGSFSSLVSAVLSGAKPAAVAPVRAAVALSWRVRLAVAAVVCAALLAVGLLWHPGAVVVRPGAPVDITDDVAIEGAEVSPVNGRYLVLVVDFERPTLFGLLGAKVSGERVLSAEEYLPTGTTSSAAAQQARAAFVRARERSWSLNAPPPGASVRFRSRDLGGASAGLAYALLVHDLLSPSDLARGRTVAATGGLSDDGRVVPVSYVPEKRTAARRAGAGVVITPSDAADFDAARAVLLRS